MSEPANLKRSLILGALWTVGSRWVIKALGFVNTVIMARLLLPEDYGVVAIGALLCNLIQTFLDFGATTALLRKNEVSPDEIHSAWTLRALQGLLVTILILLGIPLASAYFHEPRLYFVLGALAIGMLLSCLASIGPTLAQKSFNYALDFKINTLGKLASVAATIACGYFLRDYRALALGLLAGYIVSFVLSYALHPYRPAWRTSHIGEIWAVTKWLMLTNIGLFVLRRGDELAASSLGSTHEYGLYNVGADLGQLPVGEVGPAMLRALMPVLSSIQNDVERTRAAVTKTLAAINTVIWPIGLGVLAMAPLFTTAILGDKWHDAAQYVGVFALVAVLQTILAPLRTYMIVLGHTRPQSYAVWIEFAVFVIASIALVPYFSLLGLAYARVISCVANMIATVVTARKYCGHPLGDVLAAVIRPMLIASLMAILVYSTHTMVAGAVLQIAVGITTGALFYLGCSLISWHLAGRPEGLESTVLDYLSR